MRTKTNNNDGSSRGRSSPPREGRVSPRRAALEAKRAPPRRVTFGDVMSTKLDAMSELSGGLAVAAGGCVNAAPRYEYIPGAQLLSRPTCV